MYNFENIEDVLLFIKADALLSLLAPIIENEEYETGGLIAGEIEKQGIDAKHQYTITIRSAYPSVTAEGTPNEWIPVDKEAQERARAVASSISLKILGGFHSHPESEAELSPDDKKYIKAEDGLDLFLVEGLQCSWLEVIVGIFRKEYVRERRESSSWWTPTNSYKICGSLSVGKDYGYRITISAFIFTKPDQFEEIPVYLENCTSFERR